ncbi:hypothetical protein D3C80_1000710 [compost metagenome]
MIQGVQAPLEQQAAEHDAGQADESLPEQVALGAFPELADGEQRVADHLDSGGTLPAVADDGIAAGGLQIHQAGEPLRRLVAHRHSAAFDQHLVAVRGEHTDAFEIAAVEDRADHQLDHGQVVVDVRGQRQAEGGRRVLGVAAQLGDLLFAGAFHADQEAAGEARQHQYADGDEQLLEQ